MESFRDRHHILHYAKEWSLRPQAKSLRDTPSLIPSLERSTHVALHNACPQVPLLGYHALSRVYQEFYPSRDTLSTIDSLMQAIETAARHPRAHDIERSLAGLAIQAIDLQRPFIEQDLAKTKVIDLGAAA